MHQDSDQESTETNDSNHDNKITKNINQIQPEIEFTIKTFTIYSTKCSTKTKDFYFSRIKA